MTMMPYEPGCPECDTVREYFRRIDRAVEESIPKTGGPFLVGITFSAADIPTCRKHLGSEDE
jgi:hypothetical protein